MYAIRSYYVSREKLAYIVDSTAAPVAGLAVISTWIGVEIGFFNDQIDYLRPVATNGYDFFFQILPVITSYSIHYTKLYEVASRVSAIFTRPSRDGEMNRPRFLAACMRVPLPAVRAW